MKMNVSSLANGLRLIFAAWLLTVTAAHANDAIKVPVQTKQQWNFAASGVHFDNNFSGARLNGCEQLGDHDFKVVVSPENEPINPSPWFAFKVWAGQPQHLTLHFVYTYNHPRGRPWLSTNGTDWTRVEKSDFTLGGATNTATLHLAVGTTPIWVAAGDMLGLPELGAWTDKMCRLPFVASGVAGYSIEHRPLRDFILSETTKPNYVFVIGRQHPPEITGSIGLMSFVETLAGNSLLAREFRRQFQTVVVPVVNPDGVEHGHWRSNLGGIDLNRDWRDFSQPETRAMRNFILQYASLPGSHPAVFMDFHSTTTNIFYSVPQEAGDARQNFTDHWLAALRRDCPAYGFDRDDTHDATEATSKAWAHAALHIPSITCEFGYNTDRALVRRTAVVEAEDMMRLLLGEATPATHVSGE